MSDILCSFAKGLRCVFATTIMIASIAITPWAVYAIENSDDNDNEDEQELYEQYKRFTNFLARDDYSLRLKPLGLELMGDEIDYNTGTLVITHTDVSLPGNSNLEVAVKRRIAPRATTLRQDFLMGDWELLIPNISMNLPLYADLERTQLSNWTNNRCSSNSNIPWYSSVPVYTRGGQIEYNAWWDGLKLNIPNFGSQSMLEHFSKNDHEQNPRKIDTHQQQRWKPYEWKQNKELPDNRKSSNDLSRVTKNHWIITCTDVSVVNDKNRLDPNGPGEGFIAISPTDGTKYIFNRLTYQRVDDFHTYHEGFKTSVDRVRAVLFVTEITDIHGNWVKYTYSEDGKLTKIHSNDDRNITFQYKENTNDVSSVTANGRTWYYEYRKKRLVNQYKRNYDNILTKVTQPDKKVWEFELSALRGKFFHPLACNSLRVKKDSIKHPYGAKVTYTFKEIFLNPSNITLPPKWSYPPCKANTTNNYKLALGLVERKLTGINIPDSVWKYEYQVQSINSVRKTKITKPDESLEIEIYGLNILNSPAYEVNDSLEVTSMPVKEKYIYSKNMKLLQSQKFYYFKSEIFGIDKQFEIEEGGFNNAISYYLGKVETNRNKERYTTEFTYGLNPNSKTYSYGLPISITESNSNSQKKNIIKIDYEHRKKNWIIGLDSKIIQSLKTLRKYSYNDKGQLITSTEHSRSPWKYGYHQNGKVKSIQDPIGRTTIYSNYKAGIPTNIVFPNNSRFTRTVDRNGWITSEKDFRNNIYKYNYNKVGWLKLIDRPNGLDDTVIEYKQNSTGQVTQVIKTGSKQIEYIYDQLHRVYEERRYDKEISAIPQLYHNTYYDSMDRVSFKGYLAENKSFSNGRYFKYNEFGQQVEVKEKLYPFATLKTEYLDNNKVIKTDSLGNQTTITYFSLGYPKYKFPVLIEQPEGINTKLEYDNWGNLISVIQNNVTQTWKYDSNLRLCRYYSPEQNSTVYKYNDADELIAVAYGQIGDKCSFTDQEKISYQYDTMGRITKIDYPQSTSDIQNKYDISGNLIETKKGQIKSTLEYNKLNQLVSETIAYNNKKQYKTEYTYNSLEHLSAIKYSNNFYVQYFPDAFGRPTKALTADRVIADNIRYHADGKVRSYNYGGNRLFQSKLNKRMLVKELSYSDDINLKYLYDKNGRIREIKNKKNKNKVHSFSYDRLGRLVKAIGPWGSSNYKYDKSNNLIRMIYPTYSVSIEFDKQNRARRSKNTALGSNWVNYTYDKRGNVTYDGSIRMTYNDESELTQEKGISNQTYVYDGFSNRVLQENSEGRIHWIFNHQGLLLYKNDTSIDKLTRYIYIGKRLLAVNNGKELSYFYLDHLGSPIESIKSGKKVWQRNYTPYGTEMESSFEEDYRLGFTGKVYNGKANLIYMKNRIYDPKIGRFWNTDKFDFRVKGITQFNKYYYADNDPINLKEQTGDDPGFYELIEFTSRGPISKEELQVRQTAAIDFVFFVNDMINPFSDVYPALIDPSFQNTFTAGLGFLPGPNVMKSIKNFDPCGCFVEGTLVHSAKGLVQIQNLKVGDKVLSKNKTTNELEYKSVTGLIRNNLRRIWKLRVELSDSKIETFETTEDHPWWIDGRGWMKTNKLKAGTAISSMSGDIYKIVSIQKTKLMRRTFNIKVKENKSYFVGKKGIYVHNGPCDLLFNGLSDRKLNQIERRGWTREEIVSTVNNPTDTRKSINKSNNNKATAYYNSDHKYVVVDDETGQLVQIQDKNKNEWIPDDKIENPFN